MTTLTNGHSSRNQSALITLFESRNSPKGTRHSIDWNHWFDTLSKPPALYDKKTNIPGWSAATFVNDHRNNENVETISALVLDVDDGGSMEDAHYAFREWFCFLHTSYSHGATNKEGKPCPPRRCFRIVLPLTRPVIPYEYQQLWLWAQHYAHQHHIKLDPAPKAPGQFWYLPALRPSAKHVHQSLQTSSTHFLNPDLLLQQTPHIVSSHSNSNLPSFEHRLERARKLLAQAKPSIQGQHGSKALLNVAIALRRGFELSPEQCVQLIQQHFNARCEPPWTTKEIEKKVTDADTKSTKPQGYLLQERIASGGAFPTSPSETNEQRQAQRRQQGERRTLDPWVFHTTDTGNAERLVAQHGYNLRYCHPWQKWLVWDGKRWRIDQSARVRQWAKDTARNLYTEASMIGTTSTCQQKSEEEHQKRRIELGQWARRTEARERREAMMALAQSEEKIPILPEHFDADPWLLNIENGTLDLRTGELRPHQQEDLLTKLAPISYNPKAQCPMWLSFLNTVFAGDQELINFIQLFTGYALTGDVSEHVLLIAYGIGANGKSTFFDTLLALLGDYGWQAPPDLLLQQQAGHHPADEASLFRVRLAVCAETPGNRRLDTAKMKRLTGGEKVTARRMREDWWSFDPTHKLALGSNHKLMVDTTDHGTWRRPKMVPFAVTIPPDQRDKKLSQKLRSELPGILRWAVEGCLRWQQQGLSEPKAIQNATESWRQESDALGGFLESCCKMEARGKETAKTLYSSYLTYCETNGEEPLKQTSFGRRLSERGLCSEKKPGGARIWKGVRLLTQIEKRLESQLEN